MCSAAAASAAWSRQLPQSTALGADSSSADGSAAADSSSAAAAGVDSDSELSFIDYQPERYAELLQQRLALRGRRAGCHAAAAAAGPAAAAGWLAG